MKNEVIKGQTPNNKHRLKPKTEIQLEEENLDFEIQINKLKNRILENKRELLALKDINEEKVGIFADCKFKDFPDK